MNLEEKFLAHIHQLQNNHFTIAIDKLIPAFVKIANKEFADDCELQQKAINTLNDSGLKLMEENTESKCTVVGLEKLLSNTVNIKYLNRQEVEKIFDKYIEYDDKTLEDGEEIYWREMKIYNEDIDKLIIAICNLALPEIKEATSQK